MQAQDTSTSAEDSVGVGELELLLGFAAAAREARESREARDGAAAAATVAGGVLGVPASASFCKHSLQPSWERSPFLGRPAAVGKVLDLAEPAKGTPSPASSSGFAPCPSPTLGACYPAAPAATATSSRGGASQETASGYPWAPTSRSLLVPTFASLPDATALGSSLRPPSSDFTFDSGLRARSAAHLPSTRSTPDLAWPQAAAAPSLLPVSADGDDAWDEPLVLRRGSDGNSIALSAAHRCTARGGALASAGAASGRSLAPPEAPCMSGSSGGAQQPAGPGPLGQGLGQGQGLGPRARDLLCLHQALGQRLEDVRERKARLGLLESQLAQEEVAIRQALLAELRHAAVHSAPAVAVRPQCEPLPERLLRPLVPMAPPPVTAAALPSSSAPHTAAAVSLQALSQTLHQAPAEAARLLCVVPPRAAVPLLAGPASPLGDALHTAATPSPFPEAMLQDPTHGGLAVTARRARPAATADAGAAGEATAPGAGATESSVAALKRRRVMGHELGPSGKVLILETGTVVPSGAAGPFQ